MVVVVGVDEKNELLFSVNKYDGSDDNNTDSKKRRAMYSAKHGTQVLGARTRTECRCLVLFVVCWLLFVVCFLLFVIGYAARCSATVCAYY